MFGIKWISIRLDSLLGIKLNLSLIGLQYMKTNFLKNLEFSRKIDNKRFKLSETEKNERKKRDLKKKKDREN